MKKKDLQALRESRGARVMRNSKAAQDRRHACATAFRARLWEVVKDRGVVSEALIETCVSLHVQITELSRRFLTCRASGDEMVRLQIARGQFLRCLAALGLTNATSEPEEEPAGAALLQWAADRRARQESPAIANSVPSEATSATSEGQS